MTPPTAGQHITLILVTGAQVSGVFVRVYADDKIGDLWTVRVGEQVQSFLARNVSGWNEDEPESHIR